MLMKPDYFFVLHRLKHNGLKGNFAVKINYLKSGSQLLWPIILTVLMAKYPLVMVIGKSKTPKCLKNVNKFSVDFRSNKKVWMTGDIFFEWVKSMAYKSGNLNILLTVDNYPAYLSVQNLDFIKLVFLPPSTTSILQPEDQVIIKALNAKFRKRTVLKIVNRVEQGKE